MIFSVLLNYYSMDYLFGSFHLRIAMDIIVAERREAK